MSVRKTRTLVFATAEPFEDTSFTNAQLCTILRVPLVMMCFYVGGNETSWGTRVDYLKVSGRLDK